MNMYLVSGIIQTSTNSIRYFSISYESDGIYLNEAKIKVREILNLAEDAVIIINSIIKVDGLEKPAPDGNEAAVEC